MKTPLFEGHDPFNELNECENKTGTVMLNEAVPVLGEGGKRLSSLRSRPGRRGSGCSTG